MGEENSRIEQLREVYARWGEGDISEIDGFFNHEDGLRAAGI
jgi:hypothetical protein